MKKKTVHLTDIQKCLILFKYVESESERNNVSCNNLTLIVRVKVGTKKPLQEKIVNFLNILTVRYDEA